MDRKKIFSDSAISFIRISFSILYGFLILLLVTNYFGEDIYGIWSTTFATISLCVAIGGAHLYGALIRYNTPDNSPNKIFNHIISLVIITSLLSGLAIYLINSIYQVIPDESDLAIKFSYWLIITVIIEIWFEVLSNYPRSLSRVKIYELIQLAKFASLLIGMSLSALIFSDIKLLFFTHMGIVASLNIIIAVRYVPKKEFSINLADLIKYLKYSLPMVPHAAASRILNHADKYLILMLVSPTATGIYAISYSISEMLGRITKPFDSTLYPSITNAWENNEYSEVEELYSEFIYWYIVISIPAIFGLSAISQPLLSTLTNENVASSGWVLIPILGAGFVFQGIQRPFNYIINSIERNDILGKVTIIISISNIILNILLIPRMGIVGAAITTLLSYTISSIYIVLYTTRVIKLEFPTTVFAKSTIASISMGVIVVSYPNNFGGVADLIIMICAGIISYLAFIIILNVISVNEIRSFLMSNH